MDESRYTHCPNCLAEYRPGFDTCADCGIALVPGPAPVTEEQAPVEMRPISRLRGRDEVPTVLCGLPRIEAQILTTKLQDEGLVASVDEPALMSAYGAALPDARVLRVWVLESQMDEAREIARRALSGADAI